MSTSKTEQQSTEPTTLSFKVSWFRLHKEEIVPCSMMEADAAMGDGSNVVARTFIRNPNATFDTPIEDSSGPVVSTVLREVFSVEIEGYCMSDRPFETRVFNGPINGVSFASATYQEAIDTHAKICDVARIYEKKGY